MFLWSICLFLFLYHGFFGGFFKIFFFHMWTIFKVFIEFATVLLLFYVLVFWLRGMWDLCSPTRDQTHTLCIGSQVLTTGLQRKSPCGFFLFLFFNSNPLFIYLFLYLFLAVLGLRFCARAFSSCGKRGPLFIVVRGPLHYHGLSCCGAQVAEHRLQTRRLNSCGSRA